MSETMFDMIEVQGQPAVRVQSPDGAQATVLLHGAQVISRLKVADARPRGFAVGHEVAPRVVVRFLFHQPMLLRHGLLDRPDWRGVNRRKDWRGKTPPC